jgi:hypothetical protein
MRRGTALLAIVALFLSGVLVGVLGTHVFYLAKIRQPGGLGELSASVLAWDLKHRLNLSPEQSQQVDSILADTRREGLEIRKQTVRDVLALVERSQGRLAEVFTAEQRAEFERYRQRHKTIVERFFSNM